MNKPQDPLDGYMRHIARANHIILSEVLDGIQKLDEKWEPEQNV